MAAQKKAEEKETTTEEEPNTTMETHTQPNSSNSNSSSPWSFETNWTISRGSLNSFVTVESSDLPIIESDNYTTPKPPLLLQPPSDKSGPCEIKIRFAQKHEIQQVYVRSTARIYEIHYASASQSDDEYLCTVCCSIAAREEDLPHASDSEEVASAYSERSTGEPAEVKMVGGSNIGTNEDDWVEVKIPTAARSFKDFYEATAEISDVDPCMSITLRLLSLQSKGCVYVDEVYVFADPVESTDSGHQVVQAENSAGTNLMAMLVPTLLQLSKCRVGGLEDKHASSSKEKEEHLEIDSRTSSTTNTASRIQQAEQSNMADWQLVKSHDSQLEKKVKLREASGAASEPNQFQVPVEAPERERSDSVSKNDHSYTRVERVLEQLVLRVSRIEDICLRFEENMLMPINNMVERLQRVEQQVEVLAKNSLSSGLLPGTRFSAPAFSSITSNSSSFYNEGNSSQPCGSSEFEKRGTTSTSSKSYSQLDDTSTSVCVPQFLPSLVVTAPEFSCCDDEEENDVLEPPNESPERKPKQALSIDDALAAALAGFSFMTSVQGSLDTETFTITTRTSASEENGDDLPSECTEPPVTKLRSGVTDNDEPSKFTQTLKVTDPEFTGEENGNEDKVSQPSHQKEKSISPSGSCAIEEITGASDSISISTHDALGSASRPIQNFVNVHVEGTSEIVDCPPVQKDDYNLTEITNELENSNILSEISISDKADIRQLHEHQSSAGFDTTQFGGSASPRDVENRSDKEISSDMPRPSYASIVDFEIPILEVKFVSRGISSAKSSLEALLTDEAENSLEAPFQETDGILIPQEIDSDSDENGETTSSPAENHLLVELDDYGEEKVSIDMVGEGMQDHLTYNQETFVSLI